VVGHALVVAYVGTAAVVVVIFNLMSLWKQEARADKRGPLEDKGFQKNWQR
jgi:hypothetical protein